MVFGKTVTFRKTGTDVYRRPLGIIFIDNVNVDAKMVEDGWAWHFKKYSRDNILYCLEAATGEVVWLERLGCNYSASPLLADDRIYITSEEGVTTVVESGSQYKAITTNKLDGKTMASIAVSQANFFIRSGDSLYCIANPSR
jgi:outer membrane protein assembly factor BamB